MWPIQGPNLCPPYCSRLDLHPSLSSLYSSHTDALCSPLHAHLPTTGPLHLPLSQPRRLFHPRLAQFTPHHPSALSSNFPSSEKKPTLTSQQSELSLQVLQAPGAFLHSAYHNHKITFICLINNLITICSPVRLYDPQGRVHVRICSFSYPHHLILCLAYSRCLKNLFK